MNNNNLKLGKYLALEEFCTCTQTYHKYAENINPYPQNISEVIPAIQDLNKFIIDPTIDYFGRERFRLTYGFCSPDLKKYLEKKDPLTGQKNGRVAPNLDQHLSYEINKTGKYYCERLGAACDFLITDLPSTELVNGFYKLNYLLILCIFIVINNRFILVMDFNTNGIFGHLIIQEYRQKRELKIG